MPPPHGSGRQHRERRRPGVVGRPLSPLQGGRTDARAKGSDCTTNLASYPLGRRGRRRGFAATTNAATATATPFLGLGVLARTFSARANGAGWNVGCWGTALPIQTPGIGLPEDLSTHISVRIRIGTPAMNRERIGANPSTEIRVVIPSSEVDEANLDILQTEVPPLVPGRKALVAYGAYGFQWPFVDSAICFYPWSGLPQIAYSALLQR
jgi:hypothetical protein